MKNSSSLAIGLMALSIILMTASSGQSRHSETLKPKRHTGTINPEASTISTVSFDLNEVDQPALKLSEPYKSMLETTARFALAQTKVTNVVNMDTAMRLLSDFSIMILKPRVLMKLLRTAAGAVVVLVTSSFFFPSVFKLIETALRDPVNTLNLDRYGFNVTADGSVIDLVGYKTDEMLNRVGFDGKSCREQTICQIGDLLKCSYPQASQALIKFAEDNFSNLSIKDHRYVQAFRTGIVEQNCHKLPSQGQESRNCLGNMFKWLLSPQIEPIPRKHS